MHNTDTNPEQAASTAGPPPRITPGGLRPPDHDGTTEVNGRAAARERAEAARERAEIRRELRAAGLL